LFVTADARYVSRAKKAGAVVMLSEWTPRQDKLL
jgi:hypothetical protein